MIVVKSNERQDVYLLPVDGMTTADDAARTLWGSVNSAAKIHGGEAVLKTPDEGEFGFSVEWVSGPKQWANTYVADPEANAPEFTTDANETGMIVNFTDLS